MLFIAAGGARGSAGGVAEGRPGRHLGGPRRQDVARDDDVFHVRRVDRHADCTVSDAATAAGRGGTIPEITMRYASRYSSRYDTYRDTRHDTIRIAILVTIRYVSRYSSRYDTHRDTRHDTIRIAILVTIRYVSRYSSRYDTYRDTRHDTIRIAILRM